MQQFERGYARCEALASTDSRAMETMLSSYPHPDGKPLPDPSLTVIIIRRVRPGCEVAFEAALRANARSFLRQPGQRGVKVLRPGPNSRQPIYIVIRTFVDRDALMAYRASVAYLLWNWRAAELTEGSGTVREFTSPPRREWLDAFVEVPYSSQNDTPKTAGNGLALIASIQNDFQAGDSSHA